MDIRKEREPVHPAVLKAYSVVRAIDYIARNALENPNQTPEQISEINTSASFAQISIFRGGKKIIKNALSEFFTVVNTYSKK